MSTSRRITVADLLVWINDPDELKRKVRPTNTILLTGKDLAEWPRIEEQFKYFDIQYKKYGDENEVCLIVIQKADIIGFNIYDEDERNERINRILSGYRTLLNQFQSGERFNRNLQLFLNNLHDLDNSEYKEVLKEVLSVVDPQLLQKYIDGVEEIIRDVKES